MLNRRTLSASMAMGLLLMTSARTDAADGGGSGGVPLGGGGNDPIQSHLFMKWFMVRMG